MNILIILGTAILIIGIAALVITQFVLCRWIKKYNREWMEDKNEMS